MKLLAVETSTENCSAAVYCDGSVVSVNELSPQKHAEIILDMTDRMLKAAGITKEELDGIVFGRGPGSFTGVRIAASTAQGLALGLNLRCAGIVSLEALAMQAWVDTDEEFAVSAIDARMGEVYVAVYDRCGDYPKAIMEPQVLKPEDAVQAVFRTLGARPAVGGGTGMELLYKAGLNRNIITYSQYPDGEFVAQLGAVLFKKGETLDASEALPLYVRDDVAWKKVPEQHKSSGRA